MPELAVTFFAALGALALVLRLTGAMLGLGLTAVEASAAATLAEAAARRGDLTGMAERRAAAVALRRRRLVSFAWVTVWLALLVAPPLLGVARVVYALASVLWFLRRPRLRVRVARGGPPPPTV